MYNPQQGPGMPQPQNSPEFQRSDVDDLFSKMEQPSRAPPRPSSKMEGGVKLGEGLGFTKVLLLVGVFVIFVGATLAGIVTVLEEPDGEDYDDQDEYEKAVDSYNRANRWLFFLGDEFIYVGVLCIITGFAFGALVNEQLNPTIRLGLLLAAALILGLVLTNKPGLFSILSAF